MKNLLIFTILVLCSSKTLFASDITSNKINSSLKLEVYFDTDQYHLTSEESKKLLNFLNTIEGVEMERIVINGFCDDRGSIDYNKKLSLNRAQAVKNIILKYRKSKEQKSLNTDGKGEIKLNIEEKTLFNSLRKLNRKVVITILPKKLIVDSFYAEDLKAGDLIRLKKLKFKKGLRFLTPESIETLKELTDFLVKRTDIYFTINGHVCCTYGGKDSRDKQTGEVNLSIVRAKFIRNYLIKKGVNPNRVKFQGLAGKYNLGGDASEDRRVEILIRHIAK